MHTVLSLSVGTLKLALPHCNTGSQDTIILLWLYAVRSTTVVTVLLWCRFKHRRRKRGGEGATRPPQVSSWGASPPPTLPTVYIMNFIAVL